MPVCLCSSTFRARLLTNETKWAAIFQLITDRVHSIEFFARSRNLPWEELLIINNAHYQILLSSKPTFFWPYLKIAGKASITPHNSGIPQDQLLHDLYDPMHPHEWVLSDTSGPAKRCALSTELVTAMFFTWDLSRVFSQRGCIHSP
jgi:hypothetical protein